MLKKVFASDTSGAISMWDKRASRLLTTKKNTGQLLEDQPSFTSTMAKTRSNYYHENVGSNLTTVTRSGCLTVHDYDNNSYESGDITNGIEIDMTEIAYVILRTDELTIFDNEDSHILSKRPPVTQDLSDIAFLNDGTRVLASDTSEAVSMWDRQVSRLLTIKKSIDQLLGDQHAYISAMVNKSVNDGASSKNQLNTSTSSSAPPLLPPSRSKRPLTPKASTESGLYYCEKVVTKGTYLASVTRSGCLTVHKYDSNNEESGNGELTIFDIVYYFQQIRHAYTSTMVNNGANNKNLNPSSPPSESLTTGAKRIYIRVFARFVAKTTTITKRP